MKSALFLFVALLASTANSQTTTLDRMPVDGYAATVNERIITIGDVRRATQEMEMRLRTRYAGEELAQKRQELFLSGLEQVIDHSLILEEFKALKFEIPDRMIDSEINDIVLSEYKGDRAAMLDELAKQQVTIDEWRDNIRDRIAVGMMRSREIGERIVISPQQILDAYESRKDLYTQPAGVRLRMIFRRGGLEGDANREMLERAREEILGGKSFGEVAREVSEDPSSPEGGDWGWVKPDQFRDELKRAITALSTGETSGVVGTPEGFYLFHVEETREATTRSLEDVRTEIETDLRRQQTEKLTRDWLTRLRNKYPVIYHIPTPPEPL